MKDFKKLVINELSTIREAMAVIDSGSVRLALVIDNKGKLLGTVTDGDIRRGLLEGMKMDDVIKEVFNDSPFTIQDDLSNEEKAEILMQDHILAIPKIDSSGKLKGLFTQNDLRQCSPKLNPVCIMSGGFGTRLGSLTKSCPKPMLPVGGIPLLERLIQNFINDGFSDFYISTHFMSELIEKYFGDGSKLGVSIKYIYEPSPLGTGGAIGLLPEDICDLPIIVINGDVLTNLSFDNLIKHHEKNNYQITMCVKEREYPISYGVVHDTNGIVQNLEEKPVIRYKINMGIYVLDRSIVKSTVGSGHIDMPSVVEKNMALGARVGSYSDGSYWLDIGQPADYEKAERDLKQIYKGIN